MPYAVARVKITNSKQLISQSVARLRLHIELPYPKCFPLFEIGVFSKRITNYFGVHIETRKIVMFAFDNLNDLLKELKIL